MKRFIVTLSFFFILLSSAGSAQAFDFIGNVRDRLGSDFTWSEYIQTIRQWIPDYIQNVQDYYNTHPGTNYRDYAAQRRSAMLCDNRTYVEMNVEGYGEPQRVYSGYVTDGHTLADGELYANNYLRHNLTGDWIFDGSPEMSCGRSVAYTTRFSASINGVVRDFRVNITQDLSRKDSYGGYIITEQGEWSIVYENTDPNHLSVNSLGILMRLVSNMLTEQLGVTVTLNNQGIEVVESGTLNDNAAWMAEVVQIMGNSIVDSEWIAGTGDNANVMYIDYDIVTDAQTNEETINPIYTITRSVQDRNSVGVRNLRTFTLTEYGSVVGTYRSAHDVAMALMDLRG
ncbi:MAG: hypothetical protein MI742_15690 [Desulfobacterales bacterium]|nr:hypothetical protein [Desulfobacterales bacterium]